jgi:GAF domain-containing protein
MSRLGASSTAGGGAFSPAAMSLLANSSLRVTGSGSGSGGMGGGQNNSGQQQQYQYQGRSSSPPAETRKREPSLGEKLNELREQEQQYDSGTYGSQGQASPTAAAAAAAGPRSPFASPPPSNMRSPEQQRGAGRGAYQSEGEASSSFLSPGMQHYGGGETSDYHHHQQQQQDGGHASSIPPLPPAHRRTRSRSLDESAISSSASPPSGADELRDAIAGVDESAAASHTKSNGASRRRSSGSNNGPSIQTSPTNTGMPPVHPPTSPGFGGATAAGFFRSHLRAIAFTARVSHLSGLHNAGGAGDDASSPGSAGSFGVGGGSDGHGLGMSGGGGAYDEREMSEAQFLKLAESLSKDEATKTMSSMYQSLQQFRTLLVESRTLAGSELQTEQTFVTIVTRVRSVVAAEHVLLMMVDKSAELLYCSAATTPQGAVAYHTSLTHSFAGHVLRYKAALNLRFAAEKDPRFDPDLAHKLGPGTKFRSVLAVPVFNKQGAITAVLLCINKRGGAGQSSSIASDVHSHLSSSSSRSSGGVVREHGRVSSASSEKSFFSEQDQSLVEFIAVLAGSTIENALLFDEAVTRRQQTETLLSVTELMSAEVDTHKLIARMLEASYLLVSAEKITLYMIDADKEELVAMTRGGYYQQQQQQQQQQAQHQQQQEQGLSGGASASSGPNNNDVNSPNAANASSPQRFSINRGILGFCATSGKLVNTSDARRDWRFDPEVDAPGGDGDVKSMLVVPVTDHLSKPIAIIQAVNKISYAHPFNAAPITGGSGNGSNSIGPHGGHQQRQHQPQHPGFRDRRVSFSGNSLHSGKTGGSNWGASGGVGVGGGGSGGGGHLTTQLSHQLPYFTRDEEALLQSMAVSAGIILRKARALEEALLAKKRADALLQISELMSADLQSDKIMAKIVQAAYMLVRCEYILLYMVDEAKGELVCEVGKDGSKGSRIPLGHGVAGHTALTGRTLNIHNAQNDWRFEPSEHAHLMGGGSGKGTGSQSGGVRTILAIPIKDYLGKNVGVLEIINKRSPSSQIVAFTAEDEDVLNSLAYTAGAVLRKAALFDQSVQAQKRSNALLQISEIMSAEIGSEAIMKRIIEASYALVDAERITLFTVDPKTGELVCQVSKDPFFQGVRMGYGHGQFKNTRGTQANVHATSWVSARNVF